MRFITTIKQGKQFRYLLRGDSEGIIMLWSIPEVSNAQLLQIQQETMNATDPMTLGCKPPVQLKASLMTSLSEAWANMNPSPVGILDQFDHGTEKSMFIVLDTF